MTLSDYDNAGDRYPQYVTWRAPALLSPKFKGGLGEILLSVIQMDPAVKEYKFDTRIRTTQAHARGVRFTNQGVRLTYEQVVSYHKALGKTIDMVEAEIAKGEVEDVAG